MHVYQKFPCTIDSLRNWPHKKVHENWMQLAVKILWLIKNNQGLLKYSLHSLNLQVYFSKNWLRNFSNLFNIFFTKRQQILGLRIDSSINMHSNNSKNEVMNPEYLVGIIQLKNDPLLRVRRTIIFCVQKCKSCHQSFSFSSYLEYPDRWHKAVQ